MASTSLLRPAAADGISPPRPPGLDWRGRWVAGRPSLWLLVPVLLGALGLGAVTALSPLMALAAGLGLALMACVWAWPQLAAYLVIGLTPLTAGINRGYVVPVLRPNEALALLVGTALAARGIVGLRTGAVPKLQLGRVALSLVLMALASSVVPMLWMLARQHPIGQDDLLYALVMWKYLGVYFIFRSSVTSDLQVRRCLWISVSVAAVVALLAITQSLGVLGIPHLLATYYAPFGYTNAFQARGSSTLGLPAATADLMIFNLAIVSGLWMRFRRYRGALAVAAALFVFGALSAGEFSSAIGLVIGVSCIAIVTNTPRLLTLFVPAGLIASQALRPVISRRLSGFQSASGLPASWTGRLQNLRGYFWPKLFSDWNFLLGVRPSARIPVAAQATGYVWIESGYTWLLWGGGIPLLASFLFFVQTVVKTGWVAARRGRDAASVAGIAAFVAVIVTTVLMAFDPHLTYRGSANLLFALLALAESRHNSREGESRVERGAQRGAPGLAMEVGK